MKRWKWREKVVPVCIHSSLGSIVLCVTAQQLHHYFGCSFTERDKRKVKWAKHTIPDLKCSRAGASSTGTSSCSRPALHTPGGAECVSSLYSDSSLWSTSAPAYDTKHQSSFTILLFIVKNNYTNTVELREISSFRVKANDGYIGYLTKKFPDHIPPSITNIHIQNKIIEFKSWWNCLFFHFVMHNVIEAEKKIAGLGFT